MPEPADEQAMPDALTVDDRQAASALRDGASDDLRGHRLVLLPVWFGTDKWPRSEIYFTSKFCKKVINLFH
jgi:hypothetical protein